MSEKENKVENTPTPWEVKFMFPKDENPEFYIRSVDFRLPNGQPRPEIMADDAHEGNGYPYEQKLADAKLIVESVNNYESVKKELSNQKQINSELVEALEKIVSESESGIIYGFADIARTALSKHTK